MYLKITPFLKTAILEFCIATRMIKTNYRNLSINNIGSFKIQETKEVISNHKSKKERYNSQKKKDIRTNNDILHTTQKTND